MKQRLLQKAKKLRQSGHSFREISEILNISKSTASLWTRQEKITVKGKKRLNNLVESANLKSRLLMLEKKIKYLGDLDRGCNVLKDERKYNRNDYKVFLALLYWGEGSKRDELVNFVNSDPKLIKSFLKLFRNSFVLDENKFRCWLHLHSYHNQSEMIKFWSKITSIDKKQFSIYNKHNSGANIREGYKGCLSIRYGNKKFLDEILLIIDRFAEYMK